jgi:hypothetical protein
MSHARLQRVRILPDIRWPWQRRRTFSAEIWAHFEARPGFNERMDRATEDLKQGRGIPFREIPRER